MSAIVGFVHRAASVVRRVIGAPDYERYLAHVAETEQRAGRRRRHTVLSGAGLRDDPALTHPLGQEGLAQGVIDLVRAGVGEVLALEKQPHATLARRSTSFVERCRTTNVGGEQATQRLEKRRIAPRVLVGPRQLVDRRHERFRNEAPAELTEISPRVRVAPPEDRPWRYVTLCSQWVQWGHSPSAFASRTRSKNARIRSGLLMPVVHSTPDDTSMAHGRT